MYGWILNGCKCFHRIGTCRDGSPPEEQSFGGADLEVGVDLIARKYGDAQDMI